MNLPHPGKPVVAAFDFDGTLTRRDTLLPFLLHLLGTAQVARSAFTLSPSLTAYALGLIDNAVAKEKVLVHCLAGMRMTELQRQGVEFATVVLPALLRHEAMQRLKWHKGQGHRCVIISASLELYVSPWAQQSGFDDIIATRLETNHNGCVTGKIDGANCFGPEKVRRLEAILGDRKGYNLFAYGDSRGDRELLSYADFPYFRKMKD